MASACACSTIAAPPSSLRTSPSGSRAASCPSRKVPGSRPMPRARTRAAAPTCSPKIAQRRRARPRTTPVSSRSPPLDGPVRVHAPMSDDAVIEARVAQALEGLGAPWELMRIDPEFADTTAFREKYCACLVLATTRLDVNHVVRRLLDVPRVSFATAEETRDLTGMMIGGVTLLALPPDMPLYVDDRVMALDYVILGGGSRSSKIKIAPDALRKLPGFTVVPGLAQAMA